MDNANEPVMNQKDPLGLVGAFVPVMTIEKFAEMVGVTTETIKGQIHRGYLPTVKIGKRRVINIVSMIDELRTQ